MVAFTDGYGPTASTSSCALWFDLCDRDITFVPRVGMEPALVNDKKYKEHQRAREHKHEKRLRASHRCGRMLI